jgi:hypothetical protein
MKNKNFCTIKKPIDRKFYHFKGLVKEIPIGQLSVIEYKNEVEKIYMEVMYGD